MSSTQVAPFSQQDYWNASQVLAHAFQHDPLTNFLISDHDNLEKGMTQFFFDHCQKLDGHLASTDLNGILIFANPGWKMKARDFWLGIPKMIRTVGFRKLPKAISLFSKLEELKPQEPHYYLFAIGTAPQVRGKGYGKALLQDFVSTCDEQVRGAYLETSNADNLGLYHKFGFETIGIAQVSSAPKMYGMWRKPRADQTKHLPNSVA